jgi:hypothetical protein
LAATNRSTFALNFQRCQSPSVSGRTYWLIVLQRNRTKQGRIKGISVI